MGRWSRLLKWFDETCGTSHDPFTVALHPVWLPLILLSPLSLQPLFLCNILAFAQQHAAVHKVSVQNWKCCYVWRCWLTAIWHIVFVLALTPCCCSHSKVLLFLQVKTFGPLASNSEDKLSMFMELVDGVFLHKIMTHMWVAPTAVHTNVCVCMCSLIMQLSCGLYFCNHILSLSAWYQTGYRHHFCLYASSRSINI